MRLQTADRFFRKATAHRPCDMIGVTVSQREHWNGPPEPIRELFTLTRTTGVRAVCSLWTHPLGWEIRLLVNEVFIRSQVARSVAEVDASSEEWRCAMVEKGWR